MGPGVGWQGEGKLRHLLVFHADALWRNQQKNTGLGNVIQRGPVPPPKHAATDRHTTFVNHYQSYVGTRCLFSYTAVRSPWDS